MKHNLFLTVFFLLAWQIFAFGQDILVSESHSLRVETGVGFGDLYGNSKESHPHSSKLDDLNFKSWTNFQTNISYAFKADFIEFEVKIGYNYSSYFHSYTQNGGVADFTTTMASGSSKNSRFYLQPIGLNFGKERSWGNLFGGAYLRWIFAENQSTNGTSKTDGQRWNGSTMVPVHITSTLPPLVSFGEYSFGIQAGANIRIRDNHFLRARIEVNPHATNGDFPNYIQYIFNVGYSFVFKQSTRKLPAKNDF